jgi:flagellar biosynthesis protein FlhG
MFSAMAMCTLLVTTDEPTALTDAYAFIKLGNAAGTSKYVNIVVNMAASSIEGEKTYKTLLKACENFLRLSPLLAGIIRQDLKVKETIRHQTPILTRSQRIRPPRRRLPLPSLNHHHLRRTYCRT